MISPVFGQSAQEILEIALERSLALNNSYYKFVDNTILSASLTDRILQEKGIEATLKLSESNNSKVIVIGSGENGLPIILGNQ